ncbi:MAG: hypothetical protein WC357_03020 [Candidatus Omnitrophota bacterium]|jgi:hypothetical protein
MPYSVVTSPGGNEKVTTTTAGSKELLDVIIRGSGGDEINSAGLVYEEYDFIQCSYDSSNNLTTAVFKSGGSSGSTVATLTMTYDSSNNLLTCTKT